MYGHSNHHSLVSYNNSADLLGIFPLLDMTAAPRSPLLIPPTSEFDLRMVAMKPEVTTYSCSSGCSSYDSPSSLTSYSVPSPCLMQRSISSLSLQKNDTANGFRQPVSTTLVGEFADSETSPERKVLISTGDLQRNNMVQHYPRSETPSSNENHSVIESMSKACRYNPDEKKQRIERYKSKRNQRNFNKRIKYVCRKTLADSRPRIRGRFARNDGIGEIGDSSQNQWSQGRGDEDDDNWINFLYSLSGNLIP